MKKRVMLAVACMILLTACSFNQHQSTNINSAYLPITVNIWYNKEEIQRDIQTVLTTGSTEGCTSFTEDFDFSELDVASFEDSYREYFFEGSYYIQVSKRMYRFQLNEQGKIESYIAYNLEG